MSVRTTPCSWTIQPDCCQTVWDGLTAERQAFVTGVATELLWRLSGMQFGLCPITVRPCRQPCASALLGPAYATGSIYGPWGGSGAFTPRFDGGAWINSVCGGCAGDCSCGSLCEIVLPGPIDSITEVKIDGTALDPAEYLVFNHRTLARVDVDGIGEAACWPTCQNLTAPDTDDDTFSVTYLRGIPVPPGGIAAASAYACELAKACSGTAGCKLPRRVQSLTREGLTYQFMDTMDWLDRGLTGLPEVDVWLRAVNPNGLRQGARVYSPNHRRTPRVVTG